MVSAHRDDFTETRFGISEPYQFQSLNTLMELDRVIRVLPGRMVTEPDYRKRVNWAPEVNVELDENGQEVPGGDETMRDAMRAEGWDLMYGYSGQVGGRSGVIMHASEFVGGRMADDILNCPGLYVVLEVTGLYPSQEAEDNDSDDPVGWVVAYSQRD